MIGLLTTRLCSLAPLRPSFQNLITKNYTMKFSSLSNSKNALLQRYEKCQKNSFKLVQARGTETLAMKAVQSKVVHGSKLVGLWLLGCGGMVVGAVMLGGITRLTESGLSMVTWKPFGEKLPTTESEWVEEFNRYKEFPEFKTKNSSITLEEFKWIWWMEYAHRTWGRLIGGFFFLPAAYFWTRGYFNRTMKIRTGIFGALIAAQGLMGWYMVKSGLEGKFDGPNDIARVSQYRLAAHLGLAFVLYAGFLRTALDVLLPAEVLPKVTQAASRLRILAHSCKGLVFITALSGAFVAGLDAGLVYNSFPKMGDNWVPSEILLMEPTARNFTENPVTVQFDHRILGTLTLTAVTLLWMYSRKQYIPKRARIATHAIFAAAWMQVMLGITTLVHYVPTSLAAMHQSGSLVLLSMAIWLSHELKHVKRFVK